MGEVPCLILTLIAFCFFYHLIQRAVDNALLIFVGALPQAVNNRVKQVENHFYEMEGGVWMSYHEKGRKQD